jgi:DNA-binding transcriptional MocR family regulator
LGTPTSVTQRDEAHRRWAQAKLVLYPESPVPLFAQVARAIRRRIAVWGIEPGAMLPPETVFAQQHDLSRETVRRAYELLRQLGTIRSKRGVGWFIVEDLPVMYVTPEPGCRIHARPLYPTDQDETLVDTVHLLGLSVIVEHPDGRTVAYDSMRTVIVFPGA